MVSNIDTIDKFNNDSRRNTRKFYWKFVLYNIRMIVIYFVCRYLFIPKKKLVEDLVIDDDDNNNDINNDNIIN